jgi:hypothetical protein
VEGFDPEHIQSVAAALPWEEFHRRQKKPQHMAGVVSLFAVTHQGPAQGGKAGGTEVPETSIHLLAKKSRIFYFDQKNVLCVANNT